MFSVASVSSTFQRAPGGCGSFWDLPINVFCSFWVTHIRKGSWRLRDLPISVSVASGPPAFRKAPGSFGSFWDLPNVFCSFWASVFCSFWVIRIPEGSCRLRALLLEAPGASGTFPSSVFCSFSFWAKIIPIRVPQRLAQSLAQNLLQAIGPRRRFVK